MEKICKWCNTLIKFENPRSFGAHLTNCKLNPNKIKRDLDSTKKKDFLLSCKCGKEYIVNITYHHFNTGRYNKFCSASCASKQRRHTDETKNKISKSITSLNPLRKIYTKKCGFCKSEFITRRTYQLFCSRSCNMKYRNNQDKDLSCRGGKKSVHSQGRRSKNEILFSEYCIKNFNNVLSNQPIFNGWDADVIIEDIKVAVLWNGIWHYKKMMENHDLDKVNERERKKIIEIKNCGYTPYIIKDMGAFNEDKVKMEWEIFNLWIKNRDIIIH